MSMFTACPQHESEGRAFLSCINPAAGRAQNRAQRKCAPNAIRAQTRVFAAKSGTMMDYQQREKRECRRQQPFTSSQPRTRRRQVLTRRTGAFCYAPKKVANICSMSESVMLVCCRGEEAAAKYDNARHAARSAESAIRVAVTAAIMPWRRRQSRLHAGGQPPVKPSRIQQRQEKWQTR